MQVARELTVSNIGLEVTHHGKYITLTQKKYKGSVSQILINVTRQIHKNDMLNEEEEKQLTTLVGQLNWIASQTRPNLSRGVLQLRIKVKKATIETLILANKIVRKLKSQKSCITFPKLNNIVKARVFCFSSNFNFFTK